MPTALPPSISNRIPPCSTAEAEVVRVAREAAYQVISQYRQDGRLSVKESNRARKQVDKHIRRWAAEEARQAAAKQTRLLILNVRIDNAINTNLRAEGVQLPE